MRHRKLRIAWSVAWSLLTVLLVTLWVRGLWITDTIYYRPTPGAMRGVYSNAGVIVAYDGGPSLIMIADPPGIGWTLTSAWNSVYAAEAPDRQPLTNIFRGFKLQRTPFALQMPDWFLTGIAATLGYLPWLGVFPKRFSLGTLLIVITFASLILGLTLWTARIMSASYSTSRVPPNSPPQQSSGRHLRAFA